MMPPLPPVSYLGEDFSHGHDAEDMHSYAQAYAKAYASELEVALKLAMSWIDNWSPEFTSDSEWISDSEPQIRKALTPKEQNK